MADDPSALGRDALAELEARIDRLAQAERNLACQQALLDARLLRVERNRLFTWFNRMVSAGSSLMRRAGLLVEREDPSAYVRWVAHEISKLPSVEAARLVSQNWTHRPKVSVLMSLRNAKMVRECAESLQGQAYTNWEFCAAANQMCERLLTGIPGTRVIGAEGLDDAQALIAAAAVATGEYVCVMRETGILSPLALYYVAESIGSGAFDVIYTDEDTLDSKRQRVRPVFKPDWSPELYQSSAYVGNLLTVKRELFLKSGEALTEADRPLQVHHIPRVLYHGIESTPLPAVIASDLQRGPSGDVTAIICSKSPELLQTCLASLRATADGVLRQTIVVAHEESGANPELHEVIKRWGATAVAFTGAFNFSAMNNLGAQRAESGNLLFLNDDVRATEPGWLELLAEQIARPEVGVTGAVLRYPTGVLQHAGVVVGIGDGVGHAGRYQRSSTLWPWLLASREVSAVTGACLAIRKELFARLGGFDPTFPNNYNDVDLCFRVRSEGFRVICVPAPGLIHAECQSRPGIVRFEERYRFYERWADLLRRPDPYYSTSLAPTETIALNLNDDGWCRPLMQPGQR